MTQIITNNNGGGGGNGEKYIAGQDIAISGGLQTDTGSGSISVSGAISLDGVIAYGGVVQNGTPTPNNPVDIECNNGVLKVDNGVVYADGTQETISDGTNTANAEMLLAISSDRDEQNLINGKITRKIKALVLDGTEGWTLTSSPLGNIFKADILDDNMFSWLICTHFKNGSPLEDNTVYKSAGLPTLQIRYDTATSVEEFIQFLENQNTNGTPVILLYSLNTPTKESVAGQTLALTDGGGTFTITDAQITPLNIGVSYRIPGNIIDFTNETGYITEADLPDFDTFQLKSNMVGNLDGADDTHYPTAKAVKEAISASGGGDVTGPASSTDGDIVLFDGVSGKLIKDSGALLSSKLDASAMSNNNYGGAWQGDSTHTPTKGVLYDKIHTMDVEIGNKAADNTVVKLTGNQTINGEKTFGTSPIVPSKSTDATNTGTAIATEAQVYNVQQDVDAIDDLIPTEATSSNKLADKNYVNDSINSVTAYYITKNAQGDQWSTYAELAAATTFYSGGVTRTPTRNDYTIVLADENHDNATTRYIYNSGWEYQYTVNETALTQAQLDALNSGITSAKVSAYDGYATSKQDALTAQTVYTSQGTSTAVPTITTNALGQVTGIVETNIAFPVTSVNGSTGAITGLATTSDLSGKQDKATSGGTAPSTTPSYVGEQYVDTTNDKLYVATGTSSSSDWMEVGAGGGGEVGVSTQANNILTIGMKIWAGTQANYEALGSYDNNTVYLTI